MIYQNIADRDMIKYKEIKKEIKDAMGKLKDNPKHKLTIDEIRKQNEKALGQ